MKKMWIIGGAVVLFLSGCRSAGTVSDSNQYIQGNTTFQGHYYNKYHPAGNYGFPGYEAPGYYDSRDEFYDVVVESERAVTPGDLEDDRRRDRRGG